MDKDLFTVFAEGSCPQVLDLLAPQGKPSEWRVDMLTGVFPNLAGRPFRHRKRFVPASGGFVRGFNVFFGDYRWGYFFLNDDAYYLKEKSSLLIDYRRAENGLLTRGHILDEVRTTGDKDVLLGRFNLVVFGKPRFVGYFSLTRIIP